MKLYRLIPVLVFLVGCADDSFARFEVGGVAAHADCLNDMFPFEPTFLAVRPRGGAALDESVGLLMQSGSNLNGTDIVYIEVFDLAAAQAGAVVPFSAPGTLTAGATGEVELGESCPDLIESLYLTGGVQFSSFGTDADELVAGELVGASIASSRSAGVVAETLTGTWQITVKRGQPFEEIYED